MFRAVRWPKRYFQRSTLQQFICCFCDMVLFFAFDCFFSILEHLVCLIIADRGLTERQAFGPSEKSPPQGSPVLCSRERWCPREGRNTKTGFQESLLRLLLSLQMGILASVPELQHVTPVGWRGEGQGERKSVNEHKPEIQAWTLLYLRMEVVQHYNVCSCSGCLSGLFCWTTLYLNLTTETTHRAGDFHGLEKQTRFMFWVSLQIMNVL